MSYGKGGYRRSGERPNQDHSDDDHQETSRYDKDTSKEFTVWVGNLSYATTEDAIRDFFSECGNIVRVYLPRLGSKNKGFCYVQFDNQESLQKALSMGDHELDCRQLLIKDSNDFSRTQMGHQARPERHQENSVFVGNLSFFVREDEVKRIFSEFGQVVGVRIPVFAGTRRRKGFGYVEFNTREAAVAAADRKTIEIDGREAKIDLAQHKGQQ